MQAPHCASSPLSRDPPPCAARAYVRFGAERTTVVLHQIGIAASAFVTCERSMGKGDMQGLLRVRVLRGLNLAVRDLWSSDPYVILKMGQQRLRTRVIKRSTNPVWNEELTFIVEDPSFPVRLQVFDKDTFTPDDHMGDAEFDIQALMEAVKMKLEGLPNGTIITRVAPCRKNCLAEESRVYWSDGTVFQDLALRLRNVECGEVELQLQWVNTGDYRGI